MGQTSFDHDTGVDLRYEPINGSELMLTVETTQADAGPILSPEWLQFPHVSCLGSIPSLLRWSDFQLSGAFVFWRWL